jgi:hypothetical protein
MTRAAPEDQAKGYYRRPGFTRAASASNQFAGRTTLQSGSATVVVSTTSVDSDDIILLGPMASTGITSGKAIEVKSINPSNAFVLGTVDATAAPGDRVIGWMIWRTS